MIEILNGALEDRNTTPLSLKCEVGVSEIEGVYSIHSWNVGSAQENPLYISNIYRVAIIPAQMLVTTYLKQYNS